MKQIYLKSLFFNLIMTVDYATAVYNLMHVLPFVNAVAVIEGRDEVVYSTDNWDIKLDISNVISNWVSMKREPIMISSVKYLTRTLTSDRLVASSSIGCGHIVGAKDDERTMLAIIEPDGIIPFTTAEMARSLTLLRFKEPYLDENTQLGQKAKMMRSGASTKESIREEYLNVEKTQKQTNNGPELDLPFTARLMAYYRAQENKRDYPLIVDPFAEHLAGDLTSYLNKHIRFSEMDYPIVRSYYIEEKLLTPWCNTYDKSQIVLLGAGLDTRAYRFKPFQTNTHTIFEIDFPNVINYKQEVLRNEKPFCDLIRLSIDLSNPDWTSHLIKSGFSSDTPTFWVLEGLVYYIDQEEITSLLEKLAEISTEDSQIFVDILQHSRWVPFSKPLNGDLKDPFSKHIKWGLDIKSVPLFFAAAGWNVSCSFADDHDQGRKVGQKGMIFIDGVRANNSS